MNRIFASARAKIVLLPWLAASTLALADAARAEIAPYTVLKNFSGESDGSYPAGSLTVIGSTIYGMTAFGGSGGLGAIFKMNSDGTGFGLLHSFLGSDGAVPEGSLTLAGSTLYGMTSAGGPNDYGTVFSIGIDGNGFNVLHNFAGGATDGRVPEGTLTIAGSTLYGLTTRGGTADNGVLFSMNTDSTGFGLLHQFAGGAGDGRGPFDSVTLAGSKIYGLTPRGGSTDSGVLFQINTDGSGFGVLHDFIGGGNDGRLPFGSLIQVGSSLYGMATFGGPANKGVIFQINNDGTGFNLLHGFAAGVGDGGLPGGSLTLVGSDFYGMTERGGENGLGVLFKLNKDGSGFSVVHEFGVEQSDGSLPEGNVTLSDSALYGMTPSGGEAGLGTVFSYAIVPEPQPGVLFLLGFLLIGCCTRPAFKNP